MEPLLVATADPQVQRAIAKGFGPGTRMDVACDTEAFRVRMAASRHALAFVDLDFLSGGRNRDTADYKRLLQDMWQVAPYLELIVVTEPGSLREAVKVVKAGAGNYLVTPVDPVEVRFVADGLYRSLELRAADARAEPLEVSGEIVGTRTPAMKMIFQKARLVAPTISTVLLTGETGTGKGVLARLIHSLSNRAQGPFVSVHCGAIPDTLVESELFGHEKGAFTGAVRQKHGRFELAAGGSIFLDEVGTITAPAQIKLLQVLQEKFFQRVGGDRDIAMNARIIAASNIDLEAQARVGAFRTDLYYRLNVFPIELPPLRHRREDIPLLTDHFLRTLSRIQIKEIGAVHPEVMDAFMRYDWPGNVRELENLIERAFILEQSHTLTPDSFPSELFGTGQAPPGVPLDLSRSLAQYRAKARDQAERLYLEEQLAACKGRIKDTAARAGITTRQLHKLMVRYGLKKEDYK